MLRNIPRLKRCIPLITTARFAGGASDEHGTYESEVVTREIGYRKRRHVRDLIKAEREHVASLPGISSDEYKPSLEPGTINLRSMHPPYHSPQLRSQSREVTVAAWAKIALWQEKLTAAKGTSRLELLKEALFKEFKFVLVIQGDPITDFRWHNDRFAVHVLRFHGIVRGIEGVMLLNVADHPLLEEDCIELSECTWMPQMWAGGKFIGDWRHVSDLHNEGSLVQILEGCGLSSKLKGCYYDQNSPVVLH